MAMHSRSSWYLPSGSQMDLVRHGCSSALGQCSGTSIDRFQLEEPPFTLHNMVYSTPYDTASCIAQAEGTFFVFLPRGSSAGTHVTQDLKLSLHFMGIAA